MMYMYFCLGIPSAPNVISLMGGVESVYITLRVNYYGVINASDYILMISVFNSSLNILSIRNISVTDTFDSPYIFAVINDLPSSVNVSFSFVSVNTFGEKISEDISHVFVNEQKCCKMMF